VELTPLSIEGAWLAKSPVYEDNRGTFREWFKSEDLNLKSGLNFQVAQSNLSTNQIGVLRGIHFSLSTNGQAKWVTCVTGKIIDVVVDIRIGSSTFGKHEILELSGGDGMSVYVGKGLGHSFLSLEHQTVVSYLLDSPYSPKDEFVINPFDENLEIEWGRYLPKNVNYILSEKDLAGESFRNLLEKGKLPR
jgi:dTDP-4-dehydrorhamnose 3,5-epimerase